MHSPHVFDLRRVTESDGYLLAVPVVNLFCLFFGVRMYLNYRAVYWAQPLILLIWIKAIRATSGKSFYVSQALVSPCESWRKQPLLGKSSVQLLASKRQQALMVWDEKMTLDFPSSLLQIELGGCAYSTPLTSYHCFYDSLICLGLCYMSGLNFLSLPSASLPFPVGSMKHKVFLLEN